MAFDPSKSVPENMADLHRQFAEQDAKYAAETMAHFDLSTEEWEATPTKVQNILIDAKDHIDPCGEWAGQGNDEYVVVEDGEGT